MIFSHNNCFRRDFILSLSLKFFVMLEHIQLLSFILLLFCWAWLIFYLNQIYKIYAYNYIRAIRKYNLYVILLFSIRFVSIYFKKNLHPDFDLDLISLYANIFEVSVSILMIFLVYLMLNILMSFRDKSFSKVQNSWILAITALIILVYSLSVFVPTTQKYFSWLDYLKEYFKVFNILINNLEFIILIFFYFTWKKVKVNSERIKISKSFTLLYIISNAIAISALLVFENIEVSEINEWLIKTAILFLFLLAPFIWVKFIFISNAQKMLKLINKDINIQAIYDKFKISKREIEIIELIIDGKSNNEITEILFISYNTVKNHISNIYDKLNVRTRHELVHLFLKAKL